MGRLRKRFNTKGRLLSSTNNSQPLFTEKSDVQIDINVKEEQYDASNALVLPSKKRQTAVKTKNVITKDKPISNKKKKQLQKIIDRKKGKINREELIQKLIEVQGVSHKLKDLTSTSLLQTMGKRRYTTAIQQSDSLKVFKIHSVKGSKRKRIDEAAFTDSPQVSNNVPSSESDSDDELEELEVIEKVSPIASPSLPVKSPEKEKPILDSSGGQNVTVEKPKEISLTEKKIEPAIFVPVKRSPEIQAIREKLPVYSEEQSIMEAINGNSVVIIHGATGTGKTTQVPQFLYEAGYTRNGKMIGITEPRRIAATSMAARVAEEMNLPSVVSYQIRYEGTVGKKTEIKFMTDGVLLKEIRHDFLLSKYSVIIVDEAHERSVFSDVLIGLLSRIIGLRKKKEDPLKIVIMSATLRMEDLAENVKLFKERPFIIELESRQFDVVIHFNKRTPSEYLEAAFKKVCKIHRMLPAGGILVFVTGEQEISILCQKLSQMFPILPKNSSAKKCSHSGNGQESDSAGPLGRKKLLADELPIIDLDVYASADVADNSFHLKVPGEEGDDDTNDEKILGMPAKTSEPLYVLPLYSNLPPDQQAKIFCPPPEGTRLCVVATNIAETSVTIPGLKYVVDTGKVKQRMYDQTYGGISQFVVNWISKASAIQRSGRAGRTEGGHCYRLYSSAVFEHDFSEYNIPDIQRSPVDSILLQMKALGIDRVVNFPFPSPPDIEALKVAERRLVALGALQDLQKGQRFKDIKKWEFSAKVTPLGKAMSCFPVSPRFAKMLLLSHKHQVIPHIIALVSAFTVADLFISTPVPNEEGDDSVEKRQFEGIKLIGAGNGKSLRLGDAMVMLRAIAGYCSTKQKSKFCTKYGVRQKAMVEINKMCLQLRREMNKNFQDLSMSVVSELTLPTDEEIDKIRTILASCLMDHVARKVPVSELGDKKKTLKNAYQCLDTEELVFIHPSSVLFKDAPEFVIFQEIFQTSRYFMKGVSEMDPEWIPILVPGLCNFSEPQETPEPHYDANDDKILCSMDSTFGRWSWKMPCVVAEMPSCPMKYAWFCYFLLEGQVFTYFKKHKQHYLSPASSVRKSWARLVPRISFLLGSISTKGIDSKAALLKAWKEDKNYLLRQFLEWLPIEKHSQISSSWPPTS